MQKFATKLLLALSLIITISQPSTADTYPKREMRAAWLTTVWNLDWPKDDSGKAYKGTTSTHRDNQKTYLRNMIQRLKDSGFNAVNFQVRSMCDAMYKSSYEPWSVALTGERGLAPYGNWDPLAYCVEVCHELGMECHAWVNPFRFCTSKTLYDKTNDMTLRNNGWIITHSSVNDEGNTVYTSVLNPAIEDARYYIVEQICKEIVQNYDIDGMVWDDYFYPNGIPTTSDAQDYSHYQSYKNSGGTMTMGDWRRDNVNKTVKLAYDMIQREKPYVKFGIAPAGVANVGAKAHGIEPAKITSNGYQYNGIFADPCAWIIDGYIDYISPQLYWIRSHQSAPFDPLCEWWNNLAATYGVQCYISHDIASSTTKWNNSQADYEERYNQVLQTRATSIDYNPGQVYYSASYINGPRTTGFGDYLKANTYQYNALPPKIVRKNEDANLVNPGKVSNLALSSSKLSWTAINNPANLKYAVYAIPLSVGVSDATSTIHTEDGGFKAEYLVDVTYNTSLSGVPTGSYWYAVTAVDRYGYEWEATTLNAPNLGDISLSLNAPTTGKTLPFGNNTFSWTSDGTSFLFQISTSEDFNRPIFEKELSTKNFTLNFTPEEYEDGGTYYWRVVASKENYNSAWSEVRSFTMETRPFIPLTLINPENNKTIDFDIVTFEWEGIEGASYTIEIAEFSSFSTIIKTATTTDPYYMFTKSSFTGGKTYFWRIKATKEGYQPTTSDYSSFKTPKVEGENVDGLIIEELWNKSLNTNNFPTQLASCVSPRSMAEYNGNLYILERASDTECYLLEFDGKTCEFIKQIPLTGDIYSYSGGTINSWDHKAGQCIFTDDTGNLYINCLAVASELRPMTVCAIDVSTGVTTKIFEANKTATRYRMDFANATGNLNEKGGQIWVATDTDKIFRWTRKADGSWSEESTTITDFYPNTETALGTASYILPISSTQFVVDGAVTYPTLYTFNSGSNATINSSFADYAAIQPNTANYNGTCSVTVGSTPLFVYVDNMHSFSIVANKHNFDFAEFQFMESVPEGKLGTTNHLWNLDQPVAVKNEDGSATIYLYAPKNGLAAYRISLPIVPISLNSPIDNTTFEEDFDFSWSGVEGATYTLELSTTESFDKIAISATTEGTSYNSSNFNLASSTQYYWRVKASHPNYTSAVSETRSFISPQKQSAADNLTIEELWNFSVNKGNLHSQLGDAAQRSMTAFNGNVYVTYRESSTKLHLIEFNGKTGAYIRTINLTGDCVTGSYGANCVFVDDANNLCVSTMGTSSSIQAVVCTVDINTGKTNKIFSYGAANLRFDYLNAIGDVTKEGGQIWGATAYDSNVSTNNNHIYRWTRRSDGLWTTETTKMTSFYPTNGHNGTAPWIMPISSTQYIVDGGSNYPTLYTFKAGTTATYESGFDSNTSLKPRTIGTGGVNQITIGKYPLFIYSSENHEGSGYNFDIVHNPSDYNFADMEFIKTIPNDNLGDTKHSSVLNSIATIKNEDNSVTVFVYAPLNGLAAYRISLPDAPISLVSPINNAATEDGFDFKWNSVSGSKYTIEVSSSESFENIEFSATTEADSYSSTNFSLAGSTQYYWRVKVENDNYTTTTSAVAQFTSPALPTMTPPQLYVPYNNATLSSDISFVAKYSYIIVNGEKIYTPKTTLEISKTEDFAEIYYSGYSNWKEESSVNSNYEIWLQYTLPISIFSNGTYYWRVRAESVDPNLAEGISEVRKFVVEGQSASPGSAEANYKPRHEDNPEYELKQSGSNYYTLTNLWIRSSEKTDINKWWNNTTAPNYRGFCTRSAQYGDQDGKDIIWVACHDGSTSAYLERYDAANGEYLGKLTLTGNFLKSTYPCNDVFVDAGGNLCIMNLKNLSNDLEIATIDLSTIDNTKNTVTATPRITVSISNIRIDHARIVGDITSGEAYLFAASPGTTVYRWEIYNGKLVDNNYIENTITSFYPSKVGNTAISSIGTAARIYPIDKDYFYVDGQATAFTLYKFNESGSKASLVSSFAAYASDSHINPTGNFGNGGTYFIHDGMAFIIYNSSSFADKNNTPDYRFNLANVGSIYSWGTITRYWTIPNELDNFGTVVNSGGDYGMLADYLQYDALTGTPKNTSTYSARASSGYDRTNIYTYVPGNGMAAYSLTRHIYTGAEDVEAKNIKIGVTNQEITFGCEVDNAKIYTLSGLMVNSIDEASSIERPATKGVYILRLTLNGATTTHKIVI